MSLKMTGAEFKLFYDDPIIWGEDSSTEDTLILVDGSNADELGLNLSEVSDTAIIEIQYGYINYGLPGVPEEMIDAAVWWREQQTKQTIAQFIVAVPKNQIDAFELALAGIGLKASAL